MKSLLNKTVDENVNDSNSSKNITRNSSIYLENNKQNAK